MTHQTLKFARDHAFETSALVVAPLLMLLMSL